MLTVLPGNQLYIVTVSTHIKFPTQVNALAAPFFETITVPRRFECMIVLQKLVFFFNYNVKLRVFLSTEAKNDATQA